jgi:phospholipase/carboxylesterase
MLLLVLLAVVGLCVVSIRPARDAQAPFARRVLGAAPAATNPGLDLPPAKGNESTSVIGALTTTNSLGRTGVFFLPAGYEKEPRPLLMAIHGTGGDGRGILSTFRGEAERRKIIVVAPDSGRSPNGTYTWEVGSRPGEITGDFEHIRRCLAEVLSMPGVKVDGARVLIAGHSGGASTAPYVSTNAEPYTAFAVLHGGAFPGGLGTRPVRGWFSTGDADPLRPPAAVQAAASSVERAGLGDVRFRTFPGGHAIESDELRALLAWWLDE